MYVLGSLRKKLEEKEEGGGEEGEEKVEREWGEEIRGREMTEQFFLDKEKCNLV